MIHSPAEVGLLALIGSVDVREIRREIGVERALFNRSQIALSSMAASIVFYAVAGNVTSWPQALLGALLAVGADAVINLVLVSLAAAIVKGRLFPNALDYLFREMLLSAPAEYVLSYVGLGLLALLFASAYAYIGLWGLASTLVPVLLVRQAFVHKERTVEAQAEVAEINRRLRDVDGRVEEERRTDRERIAADLHDELLPALFKVHLMGQVLRQDVDVGRLLDLDEDLPQLLEATNYAAARMRALITALRRNTSEPGAVTPTLALLVQDLRSETSATLDLSAQDVGASPLVQLLIFQIAREALRNAIRHAEATKIQICLTRNGLHAELRITDDGKGFCVEEVDSADHFGLALMADRAKMGGGKIEIVSSRGSGTTVVARLPLDAPLP
jgi:signal transduction histidine kinase